GRGLTTSIYYLHVDELGLTFSTFRNPLRLRHYRTPALSIVTPIALSPSEFPYALGIRESVTFLRSGFLTRWRNPEDLKRSRYAGARCALDICGPLTFSTSAYPFLVSIPILTTGTTEPRFRQGRVRSRVE